MTTPAQAIFITSSLAPKAVGESIKTYVPASNISATGKLGSIGTYTNDSRRWGIGDGIVLSTGFVSDYGDGPNESPATSTVFGTSGDARLTALAGYPSFDASTVSFDFKATSNKVSFDFVFGSEEYKEYVGSEFNDAFGVWLTDARGKTDQVVFDRDKEPITVNTAWMKASKGTELDGDTGRLTTTFSVAKGNTYSLTFGIADVSDAVYDSTVFISNLTGVAPVESESYGIFIGSYSGKQDDGVNGMLTAPTLAQEMMDAGILKKENTRIFTGWNTDTSEIRSALDGFELKDGDSLYFYYAGHGGTSNASEGESSGTTGDERLATVYENGEVVWDRLLTDDQLTSMLSPYSDVEKWVILDACHSGGFWGNGKEAAGDLDSLSNIALIAAAKETGFSWFRDGRGILSNNLLDAFAPKDGSTILKADGNSDGELTFAELEKWMNYLDWYQIHFHTYAYHGLPEEGTMAWLDESTFELPIVLSSAGFDGSIRTYVEVDPMPVTSQVPEPDTLVLIGMGWLGLAVVRLGRVFGQERQLG